MSYIWNDGVYKWRERYTHLSQGVLTPHYDQTHWYYVRDHFIWCWSDDHWVEAWQGLLKKEPEIRLYRASKLQFLLETGRAFEEPF
jgi:hypothetical protein